MYTVEQIISAFSVDCPGIVGVVIAFIIANSIGMFEYFIACYLTVKEKKSPFSTWMHTFFLAHDFTAALVFTNLALQHDFFWLFVVYAVGMYAWTLMEIFNLYMELRYDFEGSWGKGTKLSQAVVSTVIQVFYMFAIVNVLRYLMQDAAMFLWLPLTNVVMAIGPGYLMMKRKSREGSSVFIYILIVCGTAFNFAPPGIGLFTTVLPGVFDTPVWYLSGVACMIIAIYNLVYCLNLPPKERSKKVSAEA